MSSNSFEEKKILVQSSQDNLAQLIENLKNKLQQDGSICELSDSELRLLKEKSEFQQSFLPYMETLLPFFIEILKSQCQFKENEIQKTRFSILEIMSKGMIFSCQFSQNIENLFKTLMIILQNDNEVNAQLANRVLIDIIKHFNNKLIFEENYIPMFDFLEKRTEFLSQNCQKLLKSENSQINNQQEPLLRNSESIKFLCEIPNIYIYTLNYVDTGNNNNIKDSLRNAIGNIIKAIKETPYMEIQNKMNKTLSFEIFNVMIKMLQFISIILRRDIRNDKYVKHAKEQVDFINPEEISQAVIKLLKNCQEDSYLHRIEIINSFKVLIKNIGKEKFKDMSEILDEEIIFGVSKFPSIYAKNAIYNNWIEIIQHLHHQDMGITSLSKIFDVLLKNIFDNNLYLSIQQSSLRLIKQLVDGMFSKKQTEQEQAKRLLVTKILHKIALKFGQIKENFAEIQQFIQMKYNDSKPKPPKKTLFISTLPEKCLNDKNSDQWNHSRLEFIQNTEIHINNYLLTSSSSVINTLNIYEEQEELILNCLIINNVTYIDYFQENREMIITNLIDITHKILQYLSINQIIQNPSQQIPNQTNIPNQQRQTAVKLSEDQCIILSKLFKNGLFVFEYFHDQKLHSEEKVNPFKGFMGLFANIQDPNNFRDIIESNMSIIFRYLLKYSRDCFEICLHNFLIYPFYCSQPNQQNSFTWKNYTEILIKFLLEKIQNTPDQLEPSHEYYDFKNDYHNLLQRLIKIPMKCLCKYQDDSFIRPYFKQLILILIKKTHQSKYPLEYLQLLKLLFKNVMFFHKFEFLMQDFQSLCQKNTALPSNAKNQNVYLTNLNIIDNFIALFNTGIKEIKEIITELIIIMPLKSKYIIQIGKTSAISKILINSLTLNDPNLLLRPLKTFDMIFQNMNHKEIEIYLKHTKQEFLDHLYNIIREYEHRQPNEISLFTAKLLGKMGYIARNADPKIKIKIQDQISNNLNIQLNNNNAFQNSQQCQFNVHEALIESFNIINELVEVKALGYSVNQEQVSKQFINQLQPINIEKICQFMLDLFQWIFRNLANQQILDTNSELDNKEILSLIVRGLLTALPLNQINFLSQNLKEKIEKIFLDMTKLATYNILSMIQNNNENLEYNDKFSQFIKIIIQEIRIKVLIIRGETQNPENHPVFLIEKMLESGIQLANDEFSQDCLKNYLQFVFQNLIKSCCYSTQINQQHAFSVVICRFLKIVPLNLISSEWVSIVMGNFYLLNSLTDIIQFHTTDNCQEAIQTIIEAATQLSSDPSAKKFDILYQITQILMLNLNCYSLSIHKTVLKFLTFICSQCDVEFTDMLFWNDQNQAPTKYYLKFVQDSQVNLSINDLLQNYPQLFISKILYIIKNNLTRIPSINLQDANDDDKVIHEKLIKYQQEKLSNIKLKIIANSFYTLDHLLQQPIVPFKILNFNPKLQDESKWLSFDENFQILIDKSDILLKINDKIYKNYSNIIIQQPQQVVEQTQSSGVDTDKDHTSTHHPQQGNQYLINNNTYLDDQEYDLHIDDIDLQIHAWSQAISASMLFMKSILVLNNVHKSVKLNLRERDNKSSDILNVRFQFLFNFFDMITRIEKRIRKTAGFCLKALIKIESNPKDLVNNDEKLKMILRPVLICLQQDFKYFSPSFLHILKKLLKLLTQCFNKALSDKLIEHLSQNRQLNLYEFKCISGLLSLFEHLSYAYQQANSSQYALQSLETIIKSSQKIEQPLSLSYGKQMINKLTRRPLTKFLNKMSNYSFELLSKQENMQEYSRLFLDVLKQDEANVLRERFSQNSDNLINRILGDKQDANKEISSKINIGLRFIRILSKKNPQWLLNNPSIVERIQENFKNYWILKKGNHDDFLTYVVKSENILILKMMVNYCYLNKNDVEKIFQMLEIFNCRNSYDYSFLKKFYKYQIPNEFTTHQKRAIFQYFLKFIERSDVKLETKVNASFIIIYPMLLTSFKKGEAQLIFDNQTLEKFLAIIQIYKAKDPNLYNRLDVEILQICSLMMLNMKDEFSEYKRKIDLITFCWNMLKCEDKILKNMAYIFACKFIVNFGLPEEKVIQIYISLLKSQEYMNQHDNDVKILSRKALDILIPQLPYISLKKSSQSGTPVNEQLKDPEWIMWTYKIFNEESCILNNNFALGRFWHIFIKNHEVYYNYRKGFNTQMINSMQYIFVSSNSNHLYKKIASDLSFIYIEWLYKELREHMDQFGDDSQKKIEYLQQIKDDQCPEIFLNFFIKLALHNCSDKEDKEVIKRSLYLLKKIFIIWPDTKIKFETIQRQCTTLSKNEQLQIDRQLDRTKFNFTLLTILNTLIEFEKPENILDNIDVIFSLLNVPRLNNCFNHVNDNPYLIKQIIKIISKLFNMTYVINQTHEKSLYFLKQLEDLLEIGLHSYIQALRYQEKSNKNIQINIYITIKILHLLFEYDDSFMNHYLNNIKEVTSIFVDIFIYKKINKLIQKYFKGKSCNDSEDLLQSIDDGFTDENFESAKYTYMNLREFLVILLRILATKFNSFQNKNDQKQILEDIFMNILENMPDYYLKLEIINILKCLFLPDHVPYVHHRTIRPAQFSDEAKINFFLDPNKITKFLRFFDGNDDKNQKNLVNFDEKILLIYNEFLTEMIKRHSNVQIELSKLRQLMLLLIKKNSYDINKYFFNLFEVLFSNFVKGKLFLIFGEYNQIGQQEEEILQEGIEVFQFAIHYSIYHISNNANIQINQQSLPKQIKQMKINDNSSIKETLKEMDFIQSEQIESTQMEIETSDSSIIDLPLEQKIFIGYCELFTSDMILYNDFSKKTWSNVFEYIWNTSNPGDRSTFLIILENYLLKTYISYPFANCLLDTIIKHEQDIQICPEKVQYIAKRLNCWFPALNFLDSKLFDGQIQNLQETDCSGYYASMHEILYRLNETDYMYGLDRLMTTNPQIKLGVFHVQMRDFSQAFDQFSVLLNNNELQDDSHYFDLIDRSISEQNWAHILKNLNQWGALAEIAELQGNLELKLESAWQRKDIELLENCMKEFPMENSFGFILQAFAKLKFQDSQIQQTLINQGIQCAIHEWMALPETVSSWHKNILLNLQCLVELEEANLLFPKIKDSNVQQLTGSDQIEQVFQEIITQTSYWRERIPKKSEDLTIWKTILDQRQYLFGIINKKLKKLLSQYLVSKDEAENDKKITGFNDIIWNNLKYIQAERNFSIIGNALKYKIDDKEPLPQDIYLKVKETLYALIIQQQPIEIQDEIINKAFQNEFITNDQKAEILRIKVITQQITDYSINHKSYYLYLL